MGRRAISVAEKNARKRFGASLRRERTALGMGLHEAARASGLNHTSLARMENGQRPINPVDLRSLASCYNVPWQALVIAQSGQLPMALAASAMQAPQLGDRKERFARRVTYEEKRQLEMFLGYLRFTLQIAEYHPRTSESRLAVARVADRQ